MNESELNRKLVKSLNEVPGCLFWKNHGNMFSANLPDISGMMGQYSFHIEGKIGKVPKRPTTPILKTSNFSSGQLEFLDKIASTGSIAMISIYLMDAKLALLLPVNPWARGYQYLLNNELILAEALSNSFQIKYTKQMFDVEKMMHGIYNEILRGRE